MPDIDIKRLAAAIARTNNHPHPDVYASTVAGFYDDVQPTVEPIAPADAEVPV
jgi:hypothetical protein